MSSLEKGRENNGCEAIQEAMKQALSLWIFQCLGKFAIAREGMGNLVKGQLASEREEILHGDG